MTRPYDITLTGYVGADPQVSQAGTQGDYARFRIGCTPSKRTPNGWEDLETIWWTVKAWGRLARAVRANVKKGMGLVVTGQPRVEKWADAAGVEREEFCVYLNRVAIDLTAGNYVWCRACDQNNNPILHTVSSDISGGELGGEGAEAVAPTWQVGGAASESAEVRQDAVKALSEAATEQGE